MRLRRRTTTRVGVVYELPQLNLTTWCLHVVASVTLILSLRFGRNTHSHHPDNL